MKFDENGAHPLVELLKRPDAMSRMPTRGAAAVVGRSVAVCVHPYAAWRRYRAFVATAYFTLGFVIVLSGLLLVSSLTR